MRKTKIFLIVLLSLLMIGVCSVLPLAVTEIQDYRSRNQMQYSRISPVQLEFAESGLPIFGKFALLQDYTTLELTESEAAMSRDDLLTAVLKNLQPYIEQNYLPNAAGLTLSAAVPALVFNPEKPTENFIAWLVELTNPKYPYQCINAAVDDETGELLVLGFETDDDFFLNTNLETFCIDWAQHYFASLDIELSAADVSEAPYRESNTLTVQYRFEDVIYGEIRVAFSVYPQGFYMYFG